LPIPRTAPEKAIRPDQELRTRFFRITHWPDFRRDAFIDAIVVFQKRERRFGLVSEQIQTNK
jgi:hypothetical protein